jgi:hypothetical protein
VIKTPIKAADGQLGISADLADDRAMAWNAPPSLLQSPRKSDVGD